jgi:hypothetical protein
MQTATFDVVFCRDDKAKNDGLIYVGGDRSPMHECRPDFFRQTLEYVCAKQNGEGEVIVSVPKRGFSVLAKIAVPTARLLLDCKQEMDILNHANGVIEFLCEEDRLTGTFVQGGRR